MQLLKEKSIIRYFPPYRTAGFATSRVRTPNRLPSPPASIKATISFAIYLPSCLKIISILNVF
jgi:hypothetical protein